MIPSAELETLTPERARIFTDGKLWDTYHQLHAAENDLGHDVAVSHLAIVLSELKKRGLLNEYPWSASAPLIPNPLDAEAVKTLGVKVKEEERYPTPDEEKPAGDFFGPIPKSPPGYNNKVDTARMQELYKAMPQQIDIVHGYVLTKDKGQEYVVGIYNDIPFDPRDMKLRALFQKIAKKPIKIEAPMEDADGFKPEFCLALVKRPAIDFVDMTESVLKENDRGDEPSAAMGYDKNIVIVPEAVSIYGAFLTHGADEKPAAINVAVKGEWINDAVLSQIARTIQDAMPYTVMTEKDPAKITGGRVPLYDLCLVPYNTPHNTRGKFEDTQEPIGGTPQGGIGSEQPVIAPPESQKESTTFTRSELPAGQVPESGSGTQVDPADDAEGISQQELAMGTKHEMEHTDDPAVARRTAIDHLRKYKDYYSVLAQAEKTMQKRSATQMDIDDNTGHTPEDSRTFDQATGHEGGMREAIQSYVIHKTSSVKTVDDARKLLKKFGGSDKGVDETSTSFRFRQEEPSRFSIMRTKHLSPDVSIVTGELKVGFKEGGAGSGNFGHGGRPGVVQDTEPERDMGKFSFESCTT